MTRINTVAVLGAGVIGASWASLFLAAGIDLESRQRPTVELARERDALIVEFLRSRKAVEFPNGA